MQFLHYLNGFPIKQSHIFSAISSVVGNCYLAFAGDLKGFVLEVHAAAISSGVAGNLAAVHFKFTVLSQKYASA